MTNVNQFLFLEAVDGELRLIEEPVIQDPNVEINANFFDFEDMNNDGLPDLVVQAFSADYLGREFAGIPDIYINRGGVLSRLDTKNFPGLSNRFVPSQAYMHDVNQDGFVDLVIFGLTAGQYGDIEIYRANKNIE